MQTLKPVILFRRDRENTEELEIARKYFELSESRINLQYYLVIGRYSVLPYFLELENDLEILGSRLINSHKQHLYIANFDYYQDVKEYTPRTYFNLVDVPKDDRFYILKGRTNSKKFEWNTKMFAKGFKEAVNIYTELSNDPLLNEQGIIIRDYIPLVKLDEMARSLPVSNEWRFFYYKEHRLSHGFYWSSSEKMGSINQEGLDFADKMAKIFAPNVNFFVLDIAQKLDGSWILIEANDGQMSGLSENDPNILYENLAKYAGVAELAYASALRAVGP